MGKSKTRKKGAVKRPVAGKKPRARASEPSAKKRSKAAKKGWETRKARAAQATKAKRSQAAKRGWQKRHTSALEAEGLNPRSAETLGELSADRQQLLHNLRLTTFGPVAKDPDFTGRNASALEVMKTMVQHRDMRWELFLQVALEAAFTVKQARTAFFSPSVKRMTKARGFHSAGSVLAAE